MVYTADVEKAARQISFFLRLTYVIRKFFEKGAAS